MYSKKNNSIIKHLDFIFLDIAAMYISYFFVYICLCHSTNFAESSLSKFMLLLYFCSDIFAVFLLESYKNVLKRGYFIEACKCVLHTGLVTLLVITFMYMAKVGQEQSRLQIGLTFLLFSVVAYVFRIVQKRTLRTKTSNKYAPALLLVTTSERVEKVISQLLSDEYNLPVNLIGICILDKSMTGAVIKDIPVVANRETVLDYACKNWVDEVLFELDSGYVRPNQKLQDGFIEMGITTHTKLYGTGKDVEWQRTVERYGPYTVITRSQKMISNRERVLKRLLDILGGIVGSLITIVLFIFIAPAIYIQSPGPILFKQERIGLNGRHFKMIKFRSMVLNADELKEKYADQNRVGDGMMFKLDWDPRIIGNKELPDGTKKTGIGEFIRKTSLDEFPQFFNVLKGDMSLVGTRPPTLDEWEKYNLNQRGRMAIKPGITGMWQVSGRSEITDFDEVVALDRDYISNWSFGLDIKILFKTVKAVIKREGSM